MIKKLKQAVKGVVYACILVGASVVTCWLIGAMLAVATGGYRSVLSVLSVW